MENQEQLREITQTNPSDQTSQNLQSDLDHQMELQRLRELVAHLATQVESLQAQIRSKNDLQNQSSQNPASSTCPLVTHGLASVTEANLAYRPPPRVSAYQGEPSSALCAQKAPFNALDHLFVTASNPVILAQIPSSTLVARADDEKKGMTNEESEKLNAIEKRLRAIESENAYDPVQVVEMCLVPDVIIPNKLKIPEFEKYTGTQCPMTHLKLYYNKMAAYRHNEKLLIHCFHESLGGATLNWYVQLDGSKIKTWDDLANAFIWQYKYNMEIVPDRSDLQSMEKGNNETVKEYAQRWREKAAQIIPPLSDKELISLFVGTFEAPYYSFLIRNASTNFADMVIIAERVEQGLTSGKIEHTNAKPETPSRNKNEALQVGNIQPSHLQSRSYHSISSSNGQQLPVSYRDIYYHLLNAQQIAPVSNKPLQPPFPKWYNPNATCEYHAGEMGHSINSCQGFKKQVDNMIQKGLISFEEKDGIYNICLDPLPNRENTSDSE